VVAALALTGLFLHAAGVSTPGLAESSPVVLGFPHPKAGIEESAHPLAEPTSAPAGGGPYAFMAVQSNGTTPVAYDPCRPIHYVIRPDNAPPGGQQLITSAIARVSQLTGLRFVYDGTTGEPPAKNRALYQPDRYGKRWAPVLISWDTTAEDPTLAAEVAGEAGSARVGFPGRPAVYVTGSVALDAAQFAQLLIRPGGTAAARAIVLHELGHLVGLAHVADPTQLMFPEASPGVVDFAAGDLTGLAQLGAGACIPEL
jgi:Matrixin